MTSRSADPDVPFDFFPYAGIQRDVCLYTTPKAAYLESVRVTTAVGADGVATVTIAGRVVGVSENLIVDVKCASRQPHRSCCTRPPCTAASPHASASV